MPETTAPILDPNAGGSVSLADTVTLPLSEIKPYWRNPRRIPEEAIESVAESIRRYGYQQPIVVDKDHVIVVGHTRHQALQRLGYIEAPVYVTQMSAQQVQEYRLIDNRTGEMTSWDYGALVLELREFEVGLLSQFFPDVDLEIGLVNGAVTQQNVEDAAATITQIPAVNSDKMLTTTVVCPSCFHEFAVRTHSLPGLTADDLDQLTNADARAE